MRALVKKAEILRDDAPGVISDLKQDLKGMSSRGIVAGGKTAKLATNATGGAAKGAKSGIASGASAASGSASQTAGGATSGASHVASSVSSQVQSTAHSATAAGDKTVTSYTGKVKSSVGKVKGKFQEGLATTKGEMGDHEAKVQGGTQQVPGQSQGKISEGQAKVNAAAAKEPEKPHGIWGHIVSAAKWVAEKLKAAFQFVAKLLTDPGFWVSLIVAVALTAFVIATFGSGLAVLVVAGAIIGAISAGAGQVVTNLAEGKKWNEGLGTAMLIGGVTGLIPGAGKALGTVGSKIAGKFGASMANSVVGRMGSKIASSALGRGVTALSRGVVKVGGKLGELGSKAAKSPLGKVVTAPFRAAERLGTKAGTAVRGGLEDRFPTSSSRACPPRPAARRDARSPTTPTTVAKDATKKVDDGREPAVPARPIDEVDRRQQGPGVRPRAAAAQGVLREPAARGGQRQPVRTSRTDQMVRRAGNPRVNPDGSPYGYGIEGRYDVRALRLRDRNLTEVTMKVHLSAGTWRLARGPRARARRHAQRASTTTTTAGKMLPNGDRAARQRRVHATTRPLRTSTSTSPGGGRPAARTRRTGIVDDPSRRRNAHELGHQMGLPTSTSTRRRSTAATRARRASTTTTA